MTLRQPGDASGLVQVVLGSQWGDEGKGKLIDFLAEHVDIVARCQGGNNAGHTVVVGDRSYDFHLIPSGIIWPRCVAVIGNGVVIHLPDLFEELHKVEAKGLLDWQSRLKISDRAHLVFDFHKHVDGMQESERSLDLGQLGTTKKGIGPAYASKANRNGLRMSDLLGDFRLFSDKFSHLVDGYSARFKLLHVNKDEEMERYRQLAEKVRPLVTETVSFIHDQMRQGRRLLIEGANASMLDIDFGTYPFVTSSNCSIGGVCTGLGLPPTMIGHVFGVVKAYTTRVGDGPFPTEQLNDTGKMLQQKGQEFGVTTGRERRCGWLDIPVLKFSHLINGYTALALTKLDVLEDLDEIQIGLEYQLKGQSLSNVPSNVDDLAQVTVKYITLPGWKTKIGQCKHFHELPATAQGYVHAIESYLGVPIRWIGVGPAREQMIVKT